MGDRLATIDMGRKVGGCAPFVGKLYPDLTWPGGLGRGLSPYQVASWFNRFATTDIGKIWGLWPFGGAGFQSNTMWPGPRPTYLAVTLLLLIITLEIDLTSKLLKLFSFNLLHFLLLNASWYSDNPTNRNPNSNLRTTLVLLTRA